MALYAFVSRRPVAELTNGQLLAERRHLVGSLSLAPVNRSRINTRLDELTAQVRERAREMRKPRASI